MQTIRRRLTLGYTGALVASLAVFGGAVYYELTKPDLVALDERLALEADLGVRWLEESYRVLGSVVRDEPQPTLAVGIDAYFESVRDYLVVFDPQGRVLFLSESVRSQPFTVIERFTALARRPPRARWRGVVEMGPPAGLVRVLASPVRKAGNEIGTLVVATSLDNPSADPNVLLRAMFVVAPIILLASVGIGALLAGRALGPLQGIMDEVEAISDGRSLHRRVAVPLTGDELARLALTVNGMLARLEQSFGSLRRFTADASHELKTPLMVLRAGVERALTDQRTPPETLGNLDETLQQINRMSEMVENLLTLARADEGRAPLAVTPVDLRELVEEAGETAELLAEDGSVSVATRVPEEAVLLPVDRVRIREMLLNLATNAIKYTPAGGAVELALQQEPRQVQIVVKDTGIGIAPGDLPHIFERFWRADPARSRTGERPGTGLGLAITKWIAEAHGGSIAVQSRPGRGTTFTVTLPREDGARPGGEEGGAAGS